MNWNKSPLVRWGIEILAFFSYLTLFAPWFILLGLYVKGTALLAEYGKFALLALIAWCLTHYLKPKNENAAEKISRSAAILLIVTGLVMTAVLFVLPVLNSKPAFASIAGYLILGLFAWAIGARKAVTFYTNYEMQKQLLLGTLGFAALFYFANHVGLAGQVYSQSLPFIVFWLPATALVMGILRMFELQGEADVDRIKKWLNHYLMIIVVCLLLALLIGFIGPWVFQYIRIPLQYLWHGITSLIIFAASWLAYFAQFVVNYIMSLFTNSDFKLNPPGFPEFVQEEPVGDFSPATRSLLMGFQWVLLALVILIVARFLYYYLTQNHRTARKKQQVDSRESFSSAEALKDWGRRQLKRMAMSLKEKADALNLFKKQKSAVDIYHALLDMAARKGTVRPLAMTAHRFQTQLLSCFSGRKDETDSIFYSFVEELYAEKEVSPEKLEKLRTNLAVIRKEKKE